MKRASEPAGIFERLTAVDPGRVHPADDDAVAHLGLAAPPFAPPSAVGDIDRPQVEHAHRDNQRPTPQEHALGSHHGTRSSKRTNGTLESISRNSTAARRAMSVRFA